ncbi:GSCOCG00011124001-RA-CDS [Cotesia congregata]|nr:GSCOCG00011124001-RA-CDS [Cotesia congregata]
MAKTKTISKGCPKCELQVPVACKACPCGHSFFNARRNSMKSPPSPDGSGAMKTRRTNRIKRRINYYDALEYDKQTKKTAKLRRAAEPNSFNNCAQLNKKKKRKVSKTKSNRPGGNGSVGDDEEETEGVNALSPEKQLTCSLILQEINSKFLNVAWKPM